MIDDRNDDDSVQESRVRKHHETDIQLTEDQFQKFSGFAEDSNMQSLMKLLRKIAEDNGLPTENRRYGLKGRTLTWTEVIRKAEIGENAAGDTIEMVETDVFLTDGQIELMLKHIRDGDPDTIMGFMTKIARDNGISTPPERRFGTKGKMFIWGDVSESHQ